MRSEAGIQRSRAGSAGLPDRRSAADAALLSRSQERPSSEVKIGEAAGDEQPVGILVQPAIAHLHKSKHALDDPDAMLDLRPYLRLGPIASFLCLIDNTAMTISPVGEVLCRWSMLADDMTLATIGLVAPDTPFLAMEQVTKHAGIMHIRRSGHRGMDQPGPAIYPDMRLHPEIPLLALAGLVHLGVALLCGILGRTRSADDGRVHDRAGAHLQTQNSQDAR